MTPAWDLSCPDWEQRIRSGRSLVPLERLPIDTKAADRAVNIFNKLKIPDVPGTPPFEVAAGDWFRDIIRALFGSLIDGERMVREVFGLVPKKNSKTTGGAGIMLTALVDNRRPRAEFLLIGPTKEIADLAFSQAVGMIEADEEKFLQKRMHVQNNLRKITDRRTKAYLQIKAFDSSVLTGVKPAGVLIDELHEISRDSAAMRVLGQIRGGLLPIPEAFLVFITTQADQTPTGAFKAELAKARAVRDGRLRLPMLPVLYEFPRNMIINPATNQPWSYDDAPWRDPSTWPMVSPNLNRSITIPRLVQDYEAAVVAGEAELRRWASQHLNIEMGMSLGSDSWSAAVFWEPALDTEACGSLEELLDRSEVVTAGIDGGGLDDLLGLGVIGREKGTKRWLTWAHGWAMQVVMERRKSEAPRLEEFDREGSLTVVDTPGDDINELVTYVEQLDHSGKLAMVGLDPAGVGLIVDALDDVGVSGDRVVGVSQGYQLTGSIKTVGRKLADGTMVHGGLGALAWCVGNARIELKGNAELITKAASGAGKIDLLMAVLDAAALMSKNPEAPKRRKLRYEEGYKVSA